MIDGYWKISVDKSTVSDEWGIPLKFYSESEAWDYVEEMIDCELIDTDTQYIEVWFDKCI